MTPCIGEMATDVQYSQVDPALYKKDHHLNAVINSPNFRPEKSERDSYRAVFHLSFQLILNTAALLDYPKPVITLQPPEPPWPSTCSAFSSKPPSSTPSTARPAPSPSSTPATHTAASSSSHGSASSSRSYHGTPFHHWYVSSRFPEIRRRC